MAQIYQVQDSPKANKSHMELGRIMASLLFLIVIVLLHLQSKPSRYRVFLRIYSCYCWWSTPAKQLSWRDFHLNQLICYKYLKISHVFYSNFLQHFLDLNWWENWRNDQHLSTLPSCEVTSRQSFEDDFPLSTRAGHYYVSVYLEPKWPLFWLEKALFWGVDLQK